VIGKAEALKVNNNVSIDVLIRTKDEAEWLPLLLNSIKQQENIIINSVEIVENNSTDDISTLLSPFNDLPITITQYDKPYYPGRMLNYGISNIKRNRKIGDIVCIISAHCFFEHPQCLANLAKKINDTDQCRSGFGRQIPMSISSAKAIRDLSLLYKNEDRTITTAAQFNNAFSMISWRALNEHMFDEATSNLEDVIWAHKEIQLGYNLIYTPTASVVHHHGPNHDDNNSRLDSTTNTIKLYEYVFQTNLVEPNIKASEITYICFGIENKALQVALKRNEFNTCNLIAVNFKGYDTTGMSFSNVINKNIDSDSNKPIYDLLPKLLKELDSDDIYSPYFVILDNSYDQNFSMVTPSIAVDALREKFSNSIWPVVATKNLHFDENRKIIGIHDHNAFMAEKIIRYEAKRGNGLILTRKAMHMPNHLIDNYSTVELFSEG